MVRSATALKTLSTKYATTWGANLNWGGSNSVDGMKIRISGRTFFLAWNISGGPITLTVQSSPDPVFGRVKNITKLIANNEMWVSPVFPIAGWAQPDGYVYVDTPDVNMRLYAFEIPPN